MTVSKKRKNSGLKETSKISRRNIKRKKSIEFKTILVKSVHVFTFLMDILPVTPNYKETKQKSYNEKKKNRTKMGKFWEKGGVGGMNSVVTQTNVHRCP